MPLSDYYREQLFPLLSSIDIPQRWLQTPIESFIQAQNFGYPLTPHAEPQLLISTCIEFRYSPSIPSNYAYVVRSAGGRLIGSEFAVGYVLSRGVKNIILIAHNDCGMAKIASHAEAIKTALATQGWNEQQAKEFVDSHAPMYAIRDELEALEQEYHRLKKVFKGVHVAPLFLDLSELKVHIPKWYHDFLSTGAAPDTGPVSDKDVKSLL